ncbi:MAG: hypothetical protein M0Q92_10415 [Methanoregula sp.]|jgi:hypothetical protein|nr:hypothetical protein [Methanoregula sp.]
MTTEVIDPEGHEEPGQVPAGTGCTGRTSRAVTNDRHCTVKTRKSHGGVRSGRKRSGNTNATKPAGRNVTAGVTEAARILKEWGWIVGKVDDPDLPFDIIARRGRENLSLKVIRTRKEVMNAAGVRTYHSRDVLELQPYWNSDADNIQFWLFSRAAGLLRYRVFRGGIWNVETMQEGWQEMRAEKAKGETEVIRQAVRKSRTAHAPVHATGHEYALD